MLIFGSITELLEEQWVRLSPLEQTILYWLAALREPVTLDDLLTMLVVPLTHVQVLEAVDGLRRRSLIERAQHIGSFNLHSVVLEYVTSRLVTMASDEIRQGRLLLLREHSISQAQTKEYIRQTQERLLAVPILTRLQSVYQGRAEVERQVQAILDTLCEQTAEAQGYGPANLVALLRLLCGNLRGRNLSHLALRGAYLQGVELQDANLSRTLMRECVFSEAFDGITAVTISPRGQYWAVISRRGEIRVWREGGRILHQVWQAHTDNTFALMFSPNERMLATGSHDGSVKLWSVESGALLWSGWHAKGALSLAFSPDGSLLASGGFDETVRLWDVRHGTLIENMMHPSLVFALAWSPDGRLLAGGDLEGNTRLWEMRKERPAMHVQILEGHSSHVRALAFALDSSQLASASYDGSIKLWEVAPEASPRLRQTLVGHTERVQILAWSPDGSQLASGGLDHTIRLWNVDTGTSVQVLQNPDADDTVFFSVAWSPDGQLLASGTLLQGVLTWDMASGRRLGAGQKRACLIRYVALSPDGMRLVGMGDDHRVYVWHVNKGTHLHLLEGHHSIVTSAAWSSEGIHLASGSGGSDGGELFIWDASSGECVRTLKGHPGVVSALVWVAGDNMLVSGGSDGRLRWWNVQSGECVRVRKAHKGMVQALKVSPDRSTLASCGEDGAIALWDMQHGEHRCTLRRDRPYERLNITGIQGLTQAQLASLQALGAEENETLDSP